MNELQVETYLEAQESPVTKEEMDHYNKIVIDLGLDDLVIEGEDYRPLYNALENMKPDEVIILEFEDEKHHNRVTGAIRNYFGAGVYSFRKISKTRHRYIGTLKTKKE
jgi:hypothetical protein